MAPPKSESRPPGTGRAAGDLGEPNARDSSKAAEKRNRVTREQLFALGLRFRLKASKRIDQQRGPRGGSR